MLKKNLHLQLLGVDSSCPLNVFSFSITYSAILWAIHLVNFCLYENFFISLSYLEYMFTGHRILSWQYFSSDHMNTSFQCPMAWRVSKVTFYLTIVILQVLHHFSLAVFKVFFYFCLSAAWWSLDKYGVSRGAFIFIFNLAWSWLRFLHLEINRENHQIPNLVSYFSTFQDWISLWPLLAFSLCLQDVSRYA